MPIKFSCPHCKKGLSVKEHLAGKKGICPDCKKMLVVPGLPAPPVAPSAASSAPAQPAPKAPSPAPKAPSPTPRAPSPAARAPNSAARAPSPAPRVNSPPPPAPPPRSEDVDAEAAALFSDEPAKPKEEPKTVDFNCPFCDEALHLDAEFAGKKTSCPECKRIIKVPELVKADPKDWRQAQSYQGPSGARRTTEPAPEGTWESTNVKGVSAGTLAEAGLLPAKRPPVPLQRRIILGSLATALVLTLTFGGLFLYRWFGHNKEEKALHEVLAYADSDGARARVGAAGAAALHVGIAEFYLRQESPDSGTRAREHLNRALNFLQNAPKGQDSEHDTALMDLAHAYVELGDGKATDDLESKKNWDATHRALQSTLLAIRSPQARELLVRQVSRDLITRNQSARVLPLISTLYQTLPDEKLAGLSACALELLTTGHKAEAEQLASQVLVAYPAPEEGKKQKPKEKQKEKQKTKAPPLESEVVALALALQKKDVPKPGEGLDERNRELIGQAEGLARQGDTEKALQMAQNAPSAQIRFRALLAIAGADRGKNLRAVEEAAGLAGQVGKSQELAWACLRLIIIGTEKGLAEERMQAVANAIADKGLRARAQLILLQTRLAADRPVEEADVDKIDQQTLAHALARKDLAHSKVRHDPGWAKTVEGWGEPFRAFGFLGVALGLQGK
jgi:hypothetical protein